MPDERSYILQTFHLIVTFSPRFYASMKTCTIMDLTLELTHTGDIRHTVSDIDNDQVSLAKYQHEI